MMWASSPPDPSRRTYVALLVACLAVLGSSGCGSLGLVKTDAAGDSALTGSDAPPGVDEDGDGYAPGPDCDDHNGAVHPGASEACDEVDNDCDGSIDEDVTSSWYTDGDEDGYGKPGTATVGCPPAHGAATSAGDCDDTDATTHPLAADACYDGVDSDCEADSDYDCDADGYDASSYSGNDCDDHDATIHPGAADPGGDGIDANCDGASECDTDSDGYDAESCGGPDCDDTDSSVHPGAAETVPGVDRDCDGQLECPTAVAAYNAGTSSLTTCSTLYLDGSGSSDPDGRTLTYAWRLIAVPRGSTLVTADLVEETQVSPTLFIDAPGDYSFTLAVTDIDGNTSPDDRLDLTIAARGTNQAPVANAGADQGTSTRATCTPVSYGASYDCECPDFRFALDGSASTDPDGEPITYAWSVVSGSATIVGRADGVTAGVSFLGPTPAYGSVVTDTAVIALTVTDCYGETSVADTVTLSYECAGR